MIPWAIIALLGMAMGAIAFVAIPKSVRGGILLTMLVGAIAALVMTWIGRQIGFALLGRPSFLIALVGTALVLAIWQWTMGRPSEDR